MIYRNLLVLFSFLLGFANYAQELKVTPKAINPSDEINDGQIELKVTGGETPYSYKWSNQETPLSSSVSSGLVEGNPYTIIVSDASGLSKTVSVEIPAESITEHFNSTFKPIVDQMGSVLFWDPFAAIGIYDPVVYANKKIMFAPGWSAETTNKFVLKKWLVEKNTHVDQGQAIAVISRGDLGDVTVKAEASGKIKHLVDEGSSIFNPENPEDVIQQNAHKFASIVYDEPVALLHPNGDQQTKGIPFIVVWLILGAAFFTFRMGFINVRGFKHALQLAKGKFDDPKAPGRITHFQALSTAVSATVGLGNIAGVAVAISLGGAGATFWMILAGLLGMSSKFVECTLGVKYRFINKEGRIFGGPMNYLRYGLEKKNLSKLGKFLAGLFAILAIGASFGGGNMFQANQSFAILSEQIPFLQGNGFAFGVFLAVLVGVVIIGGINSIANVTGKVVPVMAAVYVLGALVVIGINIGNIGPAFSAIIDGAFSPSALKGGFIGVLIVGFQRAAFSNEAGVGSAAIAHSAAKTNHPPSEGFVALLEPFIDTVVVCTLTALVLIFTGMHEVEGVSGVELTTNAFGSVISWFPYVLALAVFLFAFSTMISWSYYGMRAWSYVFGRGKKTELAYKILFLLFVILGASVSLGAVLDFSDMMILAMSFPNIIGLYILSGEVRKDLRNYVADLKAGKLFSREAR
ncbi:amino acid carrier protein [Psychroflexus sp. ALD_RP9]|uniref:amino acid carrier protein n=1 Tax=Psychroflexus sp. ALD_RP9 TaxID=2777186 RepID=UPI001A8C71BB|nr:amino acid carrier protein [Psychroflexus sp. ALD_RP9]QSS96422.1 amino acid carrier protein [Psychroflexus sp. ALD_RP9]